MNIGHISGGTNAGWRKVKQAHKSWLCTCVVPREDGGPMYFTENPGYLNKCACGNPRPN